MGWVAGNPGEDLAGRGDIVTRGLKELSCVPVFLSGRDVRAYYGGFSNHTIRPPFLYFTGHTTYDDGLWHAYRRVNERFADAWQRSPSPGTPSGCRTTTSCLHQR